MKEGKKHDLSLPKLQFTRPGKSRNKPTLLLELFYRNDHGKRPYLLGIPSGRRREPQLAE